MYYIIITESQSFASIGIPSNLGEKILKVYHISEKEYNSAIGQLELQLV